MSKPLPEKEKKFAVTKVGNQKPVVTSYDEVSTNEAWKTKIRLLMFDWADHKVDADEFDLRLTHLMQSFLTNQKEDMVKKIEAIQPDTKFGSIYFTPTKVGEIKKYFLSLLSQ